MRFLKHIAGIMLILITGSVALQAMPPHPDLLEKYRKEGRLSSLMKSISASQSKSGMNMSKVSPLASGTMRIPVILVQYSGTSFDGLSTTTVYSNLLNGATSSDLSVRKYYSDMSNGRLAMQFDIYGPVTVSQNSSYYGTNISGVEGNDAYPGQLVNEAVNALIAAVGASTEFSVYDNDRNGSVDCVVVIHAERGEEVTGTDDQIWAHQWDLTSAKNSGDGAGPVTTDGVTFNIYTIQPEYVASPGDSTPGVFCHELGHVLGLPDLYDTTYITKGVGDWSLMGSGSWGGDGTGAKPAPLLAWERFKIGGSGWINLTMITPPGFAHKYDKGLRLFLFLLLAALALVPLFSVRFSPFIKGVTASIYIMMLTSVLSCGSESSSITNINGTINDIEVSHHAYRIGLNDPYSAQYLFLEGKKTSAAGWYVPGTGILITHIHEGIISTYSTSNSVNAGISRVHGVNIVEASTAAEPGNLWNNGGYVGTAADLFCQENNSSLTVSTTPGSSYYTGSSVSDKTGNSGVIIGNISSNASFPITFSASID